MFFKYFVYCALVITFTKSKQIKCSPCRNGGILVPSSKLLNASLLNDDEVNTRSANVTTGDKNTSLDKIRVFKSKINNRGFPPSSRQKRNSDTVDHDNDYYAMLAATSKELPVCILSRSELYLSWWVNEDGSLRLPSSNREGNSAGFVDLSLKFLSEDAIFRQISEMTVDNPQDVIIVQNFPLPQW